MAFAEILGAVFGAAAGSESPVLAHRSDVNGRKLSTHWTRYLGRNARGLHELELRLELDPTVIGRGGSVLQCRSRVELDDTLRPAHFIREVRGARTTIRFANAVAEVTLPDGTERSVPLADARYVLESRMLGLGALMIAHLAASEPLGKRTRSTFFLADQLLVLPFEMTRIESRDAPPGHAWYETTGEEELLIELARGRLVRSVAPAVGLEVAVLEPAPPIPSFEDATFEPVAYRPPRERRFDLEDVTIAGPVVDLGATLTIPTTFESERLPAVLFLAGSGTHDRHGMIGELDLGTHEIVDYLSNRGYVGLRFDKRGAHQTKIGDDFLEAGLESILSDALAAWRHLRGRPEVDPERVFLLGHSLGGTVALALVANRGVRPAGVVLMATVGRPMVEVSVDQIEAMADDLGLSDDQRAAQVRHSRELFDLLASGKAWKAGEVPDFYLALGRQVPLLREQMALAPTELIGELPCPVLVLHGSKDFQTAAEKDARLLVEAAEDAGVDVEFRVFDDLDHLFKATSGRSTLATYYDRSRHVDETFLTALADWLDAHR